MTIKRMSADLQIPAADAPAEEWGRLAVAIPRFTHAPGMLTRLGRICQKSRRPLSEGMTALYLPGGGSPGRALTIDPDDPATAGCLLALLGAVVTVTASLRGGVLVHVPGDGDQPVIVYGPNIGRACIAAAAAIGEWPGGAVTAPAFRHRGAT